MLAYWAGIRVDIHLLPLAANWPWLSFPITLVWLICCTNAFNLIDGMDGLAAGIGLLATLTMLIAALSQGNLPLAMATMPLAGCLLGFLCYNFNPASVFLGDSGSLLIGFLLGCYGALWSEKAVTLVALTIPVLTIAVPLLDVGLSVARRFLSDRPIFEGDRGHIHHKLLDRGLSHRGSVLTIYALCGLAAAVSLMVLAARHQQFSGLLVILFCVAVWIVIQNLGYGEFTMAGEMFLKGKFRRIIDVETRLMDLEAELSIATEIQDCWKVILKGSKEFGFHGVRLNVSGMIFEDSQRDTGTEWQIRIPLAQSQYVNFYRDFRTDVNPLILNAFVSTIERGMKRMLERRQELDFILMSPDAEAYERQRLPEQASA
jgi:UDP-GlcNAc:undecaprenyl-phosphate GlcNAc-1-phosphate transferase